MDLAPVQPLNLRRPQAGERPDGDERHHLRPGVREVLRHFPQGQNLDVPAFLAELGNELDALVVARQLAALLAELEKGPNRPPRVVFRAGRRGLGISGRILARL